MCGLRSMLYLLIPWKTLRVNHRPESLAGHRILHDQLEGSHQQLIRDDMKNKTVSTPLLMPKYAAFFMSEGLCKHKNVRQCAETVDTP